MPWANNALGTCTVVARAIATWGRRAGSIYDIGDERLTFETAEAPPEAPSPSEREEDVSPKDKKTAEAPALSLRLWQWLSKLSLVMKIIVVAIVAAAVVFAWRTYTARQNALPRPAGRHEQ